MISEEEVLQIHEVLIERFGGIKGVRDRGLLRSAIKRPYGTFEETELYPSPVEKASAIIESVVKNHPFFDGNKRLGYTLMRLLLLHSNMDIHAEEDDKYDFVIAIASGKLSFNEIKSWITKRTI